MAGMPTGGVPGGGCQGGLEWYYLDSTGQEFGPFPGETMREWLLQEYFPIGMELLVRLRDWKQHVPIHVIYPGMREAFVGPPRNVPPGQSNNTANSGGGHMSDSKMMYGGGGHRGDGPYPGMDMQFNPMMGHMGGLQMGPGGCQMQPQGGQRAVANGGGFNAPGAQGRFQGRIKSFNAKQGFGFIESMEAHQLFGRDVFLHKAQIGDMSIGTEVTFAVEPNRQGMPQAREILLMDGSAPGPTPAELQKGGGGGGGSSGAGGSGGANKGREGGGRGGGRGGKGNKKGGGKGDRNSGGGGGGGSGGFCGGGGGGNCGGGGGGCCGGCMLGGMPSGMPGGMHSGMAMGGNYGFQDQMAMGGFPGGNQGGY